jgi:hypothetical protein
MEDQYLRALGVGGDELTNPHALQLRRSFARSYYQFRPVVFYWVLVRAWQSWVARPCCRLALLPHTLSVSLCPQIVLARKFALSVVALMFRQNSSFQVRDPHKDSHMC